MGWWGLCMGLWGVGERSFSICMREDIWKRRKELAAVVEFVLKTDMSFWVLDL